MSKEKYLLQKIVSWWDDDKEFIGDFVEEIRNYLVEPTQDEKPVAYWDTQEGKLIPAVPLSSERTCFEVPLVPLYLHPPRPFIRMTREEIGTLEDSVLSPDWTDEFELYHFARAIEGALEEKNK